MKYKYYLLAALMLAGCQSNKQKAAEAIRDYLQKSDSLQIVSELQVIEVDEMSREKWRALNQQRRNARQARRTAIELPYRNELAADTIVVLKNAARGVTDWAFIEKMAKTQTKLQLVQVLYAADDRAIDSIAYMNAHRYLYAKVIASRSDSERKARTDRSNIWSRPKASCSGMNCRPTIPHYI